MDKLAILAGVRTPTMGGAAARHAYELSNKGKKKFTKFLSRYLTPGEMKLVAVGAMTPPGTGLGGALVTAAATRAAARHGKYHALRAIAKKRGTPPPFPLDYQYKLRKIKEAKEFRKAQRKFTAAMKKSRPTPPATLQDTRAKFSSVNVDSFFDRAFEKTAAKKKKKKKKDWTADVKDYGAQIRRAAPGLAVKQLADLPKGTLEGLIEGKLEKKLLDKSTKAVKAVKAPPALKDALWKGGKRYAGGTTVGLATGPMFISGIKQLKSEDKKERAKGYAKVLGASSIYAGGKGAVEFAKAGKGGGKKALAGGGSRLLVNLPVVGLTAAGVAAGSKKNDEGQTSKLRAATGGAIGGGAGGVIKGVSEVPLQDLIRKGKINKQLARRMGIRGASRGAGGAAGGAALGTLFGWLSNKVEK